MKRHNFYTFLQQNNGKLNSSDLLDIWRDKAERHSAFCGNVFDIAQKGSFWSLIVQSWGGIVAPYLNQQMIGELLTTGALVSLGPFVLTAGAESPQGASSVLWRMQFKDPAYGYPREGVSWDYDLALASLDPKGRGSILTTFRANRDVARRLGKPVGVIARTKAALKPQRPDNDTGEQQRTPKP